MQGLMMSMPLTITSIMEYADRIYPNREIVSVTADNPRHRYTYREAFKRSRQLASALQHLGAKPSDCIGTLAWNDYRHFELYYAVSCSGMICHTINPRLFPDQITYIINHAEDQWLFIDLMFVPLIEQLQSQLSSVKGYVILTTQENMPETSLNNCYCYEELINSHDDSFSWPDLDENTASSLCYTSGTTGNPKGVLYSHRSTVLHSYASVMADNMCLSSNDTVMPIVPMFHVNAWGCPYAAPIAGSKMVLPGMKMADGETLQHLIETENITLSSGVPTVWLALLHYLQQSGKTIDSLKRIYVGGAACPLSIIDHYAKLGVQAIPAWGMTETSPVGTINTLPFSNNPSETDEEEQQQLMKAGRPLYGVELKIVNDKNEALAHDGETVGRLKIRGPWVCSSYFKLDESDAHDDDGWFDTGDIATIDDQGFMQITDRNKDVIKSGGEWISSITLENVAANHPDVAEAAAIAIPDEKWDERPLLIVVKKKGTDINEQELLKWFDGKVAKWWIPEKVEFVEELPHTATGKVKKLTLREMYS